MVEALVHRNELRAAQVMTREMTNARVPVIHLHTAATKSRKKTKASISHPIIRVLFPPFSFYTFTK